MEPIEGVAAALSSHQVVAPTLITQPAVGQSFINAAALPIQRLTDVHLLPEWFNRDGSYVGSGITNGYSRYSCESFNEKWFFVIGTSDTGAVYSRETGSFRNLPWVGESSGPRWWGKPDSQDLILYQSGSQLKSMSAVDLSVKVVDDFTTTLLRRDHEDLSADGHYIGLSNAANGFVYDLYTKAILPGRIPPGTVDISPSGKWALLGEMVFYRISDLAKGTVTPIQLPIYSTHGHSAWAYDADGNDTYVFQDNADDWFKAYTPETGQMIKIVHMSELGWGLDQHIGKMIDPATKGWFLMSTYYSQAPAFNCQLLMIQIKPSGLIWRLGLDRKHPLSKRHRLRILHRSLRQPEPGGQQDLLGRQLARDRQPGRLPDGPARGLEAVRCHHTHRHADPDAGSDCNSHADPNSHPNTYPNPNPNANACSFGSL